jgi:hypothetical protein
MLGGVALYTKQKHSRYSFKATVLAVLFGSLSLKSVSVSLLQRVFSKSAFDGT